MLRRRDLVRQSISLSVTLQTGAWASEAAPWRHRRDEVVDDREAIAASVARIELHNALPRRFLVTFGLEHLAVWYEDFLADRETASVRILDHLGLAPIAGQRPAALPAALPAAATRLRLTAPAAAGTS